MKKLRCKECGDEYDGDPIGCRLCDTCYRDYSEGRGYTEEEIADQFMPTELDIELEEEE